MLVESLSRSLHEAIASLRSAAPNAKVETDLEKIAELLAPHAAIALDDFALMLSKVKKPKPPKKTSEEKAAEMKAKADAKLQAAAEKQAKKEADAAAKIEAKRQAAADKIAKKEADKKAIEDAKIAKKEAEAAAKAKAAADKIAEKEAQKKAKADAKEADKLAKKAAAAAAKEAAKEAKAAAKLAAKGAAKTPKTDAEIEADGKVVDHAVNKLNALLQRFTHGNVPEDAVNAELDHLKTLDGPQLFRVAQAVNSDATLTESSPKAKILKQLEEMVLQVWKTSDNVNH